MFAIFSSLLSVYGAVLYITKQGAMLHKVYGRLVVKEGDTILQEIPAIKVQQVVIYGNAQITTQAKAFLLDKGIDVAYLSSRGKYRGRLQPEYSKDVTVRQKQFAKAADKKSSLSFAKKFITGKIQNSITFCLRQRHSQTDVVKNTIEQLERSLHQAALAESLESLLGIEGTAAAAYYKSFRIFLSTDMGFSVRAHRPPTDPVNALLSLGYTMLYNNTYAAINIVGLDPYCGFFHQPRHGHATLASDMIEEFRCIIVDSLVLSVINRRVLKGGDFRKGKEGIRLTRDALKRFLADYDARMNNHIIHPRTKERTTYLRALELQVRHLARVLLDEEPEYIPFKAR